MAIPYLPIPDINLNEIKKYMDISEVYKNQYAGMYLKIDINEVLYKLNRMSHDRNSIRSRIHHRFDINPEEIQELLLHIESLEREIIKLNDERL